MPAAGAAGSMPGMPQPKGRLVDRLVEEIQQTNPALHEARHAAAELLLDQGGFKLRWRCGDRCCRWRSRAAA